MRVRKWKIHAMAECVECGKEWQNYRTAIALAGEHARRTGHHVRGETGSAVVWNAPGRMPDESEPSE